MLPSSMPKKDNQPFQIRPPREVVNRLDQLSKRFRRESANQVAVEILRDYTDLWEAAEKSRDETIKRQQEAVIHAIKAETLRRPMHQAEAQPTKTAAHGKKGSR